MDEWTGSAQIITVGTLAGLTVNGDLAVTAGTVTLDNTFGYHIKDSGGTVRRIFTVNASNLVTFGPTATGWGGASVFRAGTRILFTVDGASGAHVEVARFHTTGGMTIGGGNTDDGELLVDQASATGAKPVLTLDQADVSEEIIKFLSTIGTGNAIEAVAAKTLTVTHFLKVKLTGGLVRYIQVGTIA